MIQVVEPLDQDLGVDTLDIDAQVIEVRGRQRRQVAPVGQFLLEVEDGLEQGSEGLVFENIGVFEQAHEEFRIVGQQRMQGRQIEGLDVQIVGIAAQ